MAIEANAGDVRRQTELLTRHLVPEGFSQESFPSAADRDLAIEVTAAEILQWFSSAGYSTDLTQWSDNAKAYISRFNAFGAAFFLESSHGGLIFAASPTTRAEAYLRVYQGLRQSLESGANFVTLGIPRVSSPQSLTISATGLSESDKETLESDSDAVRPFFFRNLHRNRSASIQDPRV